MAKIIWAETAIQDIDAIADYIALDKTAAARQLVERIFAAVELLRKFPRMGSRPFELHSLPYRQLIVPPCRVFYRTQKKVIYIVHGLRGEQLVRRDLFLSAAAPSKIWPTASSTRPHGAVSGPPKTRISG